MSFFSGSELFEAGTTNGETTTGAVPADSASPVRPSSAANGEANIGASGTDNPSPVRPTSTAKGDGTAGALRAGSASPVQPSTTAHGDGTAGASPTDNPSPVRPTSTANGDGTTKASRIDSTSPVQTYSPAASDGIGGGLRVALVDEVGLSDEGLRSRLKVLGRAESTLAAMKARALAELSRRHNKRDAQRLVCDELQTSKRDAQRDVETATRLAELPATSGALNSGDIPVGHAQLIARAAGESPIDERLLVEAANREPFDEFMQTVKLHQRDVAADDGQSLLDRQRKKRKARIFESSDSGMFVLTGEFDQITGARIATALTAKERQLWNREDPNNRATPQQRMADALAELISEPTGDSRSVGTDLLVIADFDVLKQQLENPRLVDGSPIPITELHKLALEANLLPSIFDTKTQDMWLGRRVRTASEAQRIALIARDQHCIGCGANPLWCQAHHIIWWSNNGPTNLENLVLVCNDCHHKIHDDGWQVHKHPDTGKYYLKPPTQPTTRPTVSSDKPARNSLGEPTTQPSGKRPMISPNDPSTNPSGESPAASVAEAPTNSLGERPTVPSDVPSTRPSGEHPDASPDKSARILPDKPSTNPPDKHPTVPPDKPSTHPSGEHPTVPPNKSSANPSGESATNSSGKPPNRRSGERPTVLSGKSASTSSLGSSNSGPGDSLDVSVSEPSTHPANKHPTVLSGKSASTSSLGSSTGGPGDSLDVSVSEPSTHSADNRPTLPVGEPSTHPANKHPTGLPDKPARTSSGEPATCQSDKRPTVLSGKSACTSSLGSSNSGPGDSLDVSVSEPSTHSAEKHPTLPVGESLSGLADEFPNISSNEPPTHPTDQRPTFSSGRPDRARIGLDTARPFVGDAPRSTVQNAPGIKNVEQIRRKKQTRSEAERQHPTTRSTRHDPVDGIDTS